ncbi:MAG TPA: VTT domain-containing protein [Bryobacteraceae bacterium]|nr:VTT domain-containing protein [Bryobacteraceae bacterium]
MFSFRNLLLRHGYAFLFGYVLCVQAGAPIPADPLLLIMGALVGDRYYSFWLSLLSGVLAALLGDFVWYELGRFRGRRVLAFLCKFSLEKDICVQKTESHFGQRGAWTLLFAKFIPGVSLLSVPLAGATRMPRWRFFLADVSGCLLWNTSYLTVGMLFHRQIDSVSRWLGLFGQRAGIVVILLLAAYVGFKLLQRWRFRRELRINCVTPKHALNILETAEQSIIVDLRHPKEIEQEGFKIAGALILRPDDLRTRDKIPAGYEVILYCSCPNEATAARVALQLKRAGVRRVRPLQGGYDGWRKLCYPLEPVLQLAAVD